MSFNLTTLPTPSISRIRGLGLAVRFFAMLTRLSLVIWFALMILGASAENPINGEIPIGASFPFAFLMLVSFSFWLMQTYLFLELTSAYTFWQFHRLMTQLWRSHALDKKKNIVARWRLVFILWVISLSILFKTSDLKTSWELALSLFSGLCLFKLCSYTSRYIKSVQQGIEALPRSNMQPQPQPQPQLQHPPQPVPNAAPHENFVIWRRKR